MSIRAGWLLSAILAASAATAQVPARSSPPDAYGPVDTRAKPTCPERKPGDEIVVCGQNADSARYRVKSSGDLDPTGRGARDAVPRAPNFEKPKCVPSLLTMCAGVGPAPPGALIIDLDAIPEAPEGSDADRVGKGELKPK